MNWDGISTLIGAIGGLLSIVAVPFISYYIATNTKKTDYKFEKLREEDQRKFEEEKKKLSNNYSMIYGYLHKLVYDLNADRVFIIQPHPLSDKQFISISLEVLHVGRDIKSHKEAFQMKKMSEWAGFCGRACKEDWIIHRNIEEIKDNKLRLELGRRGVRTSVCRRLKDSNELWEGSLCAEWTHSQPEFLDQIKEKITKKALFIEDILPEYKP